ncbi:olfactory marker protein [Ursus americanus]|nr:olfactory marker protein [Ursus americanus]
MRGRWLQASAGVAAHLQSAGPSVPCPPYPRARGSSSLSSERQLPTSLPSLLPHAASLLHKQAVLGSQVVRAVSTAIDISSLVPGEPGTLLPPGSVSLTASWRRRAEALGASHAHFEDGPGGAGPGGPEVGGASSGACGPAARSRAPRRRRGGSSTGMAEDAPKQPQLSMPLLLDHDLTRQMRLRVESLKQRGEKRQDGEKLLRPAEAVYRLDFVQQHRLQFERWDVVLDKPGKVTITGTSQNWTPDLTNLMTRQLLDPAAIFWRKEDGDADAVDWNEADALEFGERLSDLAKIRKVMYFLITFSEGLEPADLKASVVFNQL